MSPKVSIIMPVFNAERYLRSALESVRQQTFRDFECICVDDGSTDGSVAIAEEFRCQDSRFRLIRQAHQCAGVARNVGMAAATGECLAFLDSDDGYEKDFLEAMRSAYDSEERPEVVVCQANRFWRFSGRKEFASWYLDEHAFFRNDRLFFTPGNAWNKLYARTFVEAYRLRFLTLPHSEDVGFVFPALALAGRIALVRRPLVNYCVDNQDSLEHSKSKNGVLTFYEAYLQTRDILRSRGVYEKVRSSFIRRVGRAFGYNIDAPTDLTSLKIVLDHFRLHAADDFELLRDVPTVFDDDLRAIQACDFEGYVLRRLHELRTVVGVLDGRLRASERTQDEMRRGLAQDAAEIAVLKSSEAHKAGLLEDATRRLRELGVAADRAQTEIAALKSSEAYRIGLVATWPFRKAAGMFAGGGKS